MIHAQNCKFVAALAPVNATGATFTDTEVDTAGFHYAVFLIQAGVLGAAGVTALKIQESDASGSGEADFTGGAFSALVNADDGKMCVAFIDLRKRKRYLSLVATAGANECFLSAVCMLFRADESPDSLTERGLLQQLLV